MKKHWSFIVCDKKYLYPLAMLFAFLGIILAMIFNDPMHINRIGNMIIGTGVWMSMRHTFREGINRDKNAQDSSPVLPEEGRAKQLNVNYFNNVTFAFGDAQLQIHGFVIVILGSIMSSYGDMIYSYFIK